MTRLSQARFERVVHEHHAAVYRSALRVLGNATAAADIAQDVFVRVLRAKARLAEADSERATLCWLAVRLAQNAVRARRRRKHHEENAMSSIPSQADPAVVAAERDLAATVQRCVAELPDELRLPLELHCQDELTLQSIGSALRLSTSTVHGRVQQALTRLRAALQGRGFALAAVAVPDLVRQLPMPPVPVELEAQLLATVPGAALLAVGAVRRVFLAAGLVLGGIGVAIGVSRSDGGEPAAAVAVAGDTAAGAAEDANATAEPGRVPLEGGVVAAAVRAAVPDDMPVEVDESRPARAGFVGTVHDVAAWPVEAATVSAVAAGGLKPFELGRATTDALGAFELDAELASLRPSAIRLVVRRDGVVLLTTDEIAVPRADPWAPIALVLPKEAGVATDRYEWLVAVQDEQGAALPEVPVAIYREPLPAAGRVGGTPEALATTDGSGVARLRGQRLGGKWLFVDGRPLGRQSSFTAVDLARGGTHSATIVLPSGGGLQALCTDLEGAGFDWCNVWLEDETTGLTLAGESGGDGAKRFVGLGDGPYTLRAYGDVEHSPATLRGLRASGKQVAVRLKRRGDLRDVGDHMAEIHGTVLDAETGEELPLGSFAVEVLRARSGESTSPLDRVVPDPPAQRMMDDETTLGFHEVGLDPGRRALVVDVPGYATAVHEFEVVANELRTGVVVSLQRGSVVRGVVVDAAGKPVAGASVLLIGVGALADQRLAALRAFAPGDEATRPPPSLSPCRALSADDGSFELADVPPAILFRIVARGPDGSVGVDDLGVVQSKQVVTGCVIRCR